MIKKYFNFRSFFLLESLLKIDKELHVIISKISEKDPVAKMLLSLINRDITTNVNYLKPSDKNDDVKFVNDTQVKRFVDAGQDPFDKALNTAKIGRTVRQILTANNISVTDSQIEKFVNTYKTAWNEKYKNIGQGFHVVSGEEIRKWYLESNYVPGGGTLNNSCMRYDHCQEYLNIYVENPEVCQLVILLDDRNLLLGRALLWKLKSGTGRSDYFLDRIYTRYDNDAEMFANWFTEFIGTDNFSAHFIGRITGCRVQLKKWKFKTYPYMDTLPILDYEDGVLMTYDAHDKDRLQFIIQSTSGRPTVPNHQWSDKYQTWFHNSECIWLEKYDDYFPKQDCKKDYLGQYYFKDDLVYSEYLKDYVYKERAKKVEGLGLVDSGDVIDVFDEIKNNRPHSSKKYLLSRITESDYERVEVGYNHVYLKRSLLGYDCFSSEYKAITSDLYDDYVKLYKIDKKQLEKLSKEFGNFEKTGVYYEAYSIEDSYTTVPIVFDFMHASRTFEENDYLFVIKEIKEAFNLEAEDDNYIIRKSNLYKGFRQMIYTHTLNIFENLSRKLNIDFSEYFKFLGDANEWLKRNRSDYKSKNENYEKMKKHGSYLKYFNHEIAEKYVELNVINVLESEKFLNNFIRYIKESDVSFNFWENYGEPDEEIIEISSESTELENKVRRFISACKNQILFWGYWWIMRDSDWAGERYLEYVTRNGLQPVNSNLIQSINRRIRVGSEYAEWISSMKEHFEYLDFDNLFSELGASLRDDLIFTDFLETLNKKKQ